MRSGAFKSLCHIRIYTVKWTYDPIWESIFSVFWASCVLKSIFPDLSASKEARETKKIHLKFFIQKGLPPTWETTVNQAHVMEQGGMALRHQTTMGPHPGFLPSAPTAIQFQAPPPTNNEIENTLARIQQQYTTLASQLATQKTDQKSPEASGAPRLNQYPLV